MNIYVGIVGISQQNIIVGIRENGRLNTFRRTKRYQNM